jgi:hypothetical protein
MIRLLVVVSICAFVLAVVGGATGSFADGFFVPLGKPGARKHGRLGPTWADHALGLSIATAFIAIVLASAHTLGFMRDEGMYFDASKSYAIWFEKLLSKNPADRAWAMERQNSDSLWQPNSEHPSLMKSGFALSWIYLWKTWPAGLVELLSRVWITKPLAWLVAAIGTRAPKLFIEESAAFRFPGMVAGGLVLYLTYLFGAEARGRAAGLCAALFYAVLPRPFFDAHLAGFDAAAALAWLAVAYAYWRGLRDKGWAVAAGLVWGLALLTKHNSWFLPVVFVAHYAWASYDVLRARPGAHPTLAGRAKLLQIPWPFLFMGMLGPAIFMYGWPRVWYDTWARVDWYFSFHAHHDYYNFEYLHRTYFQPPQPISMPIVMALATVPAAILFAATIATGERWRALLSPLLPSRWLPAIEQEQDAATVARAIAEGRGVEDPRRTAFFWFFNMVLPIALISHPKVPHFGGTKHWHPAYPFVCLFAGAGVVLAAERLAALSTRAALAGPPRWLVHALAAVTFALVFTPAALATARSHPHGLTHYTPLVGGPAGGADLGLMRGFWGYETGALVDWLNVHFPNGGRVYPNDTFYSSFEQLKIDGRLHANIEQEWGSASSADVAVVEHEQHMDECEPQIWMLFGTVTPAYVVTLDGVPAMTVYVNPKSQRFVP